MKVVFEYKDSNGNIDKANTIERELSNDEILIILKSNEITYQIKMGLLYTAKCCVIENTVYDMFMSPYLRIILKEKYNS